MDDVKQNAATEVLELGEMLFDTAIDAVNRGPVQDDGVEKGFVEEMRAAADEFFVALRLLLGVEKQGVEG
jgi:hypothetical protein